MALIFFLLVGAVSALDSDNVSVKEDSNLDDSVYTLSSQNKLEISNEVSISETNIVNSQNDNLKNTSSGLSSSNSDEDNGIIAASNDEAQDNNTLLNYNGDVTSSSQSSVLSASSKKNVKLDVLSASSGSVDSCFRVKITDSSTGKALSNQKVSLTVNGKTLVGTSGSNGIALIVGESLSGSSYTVKLMYAGNSNYNELSVSQKVKITKKVNVNLVIANPHCGNNATVFKILLKDNSTGKAIAGQNILLTLDGKKYAGVTGSNGIVEISTKYLPTGTYTVSVKFASNSYYDQLIVSQKVNVLTSIVTRTVVQYYAYTIEYKAICYKDGAVLANTSGVKFTVNGKSYTVSTDKKGVASVNLSLPMGNYVISSYNPYSKETVNNTISFVKDKSIISHGTLNTYIATGNKYLFSVTLKSKSGVLIKDADVNFYYRGNMVTAKTDENGEASMTIPVLAKGTHDIIYKFTGNDMFYASSESGKWIVQDSLYSLTGSDLNMTYKDGSSIGLQLKYNGKVFPKKTMKWNFNDKVYYSVTNSNGYVYFNPGDVKPGVYYITCSHGTPGAADYISCVKKITVGKLTANVVASDLTINYKDNAYYMVTAKDKSGKILKDTNVIFTLDGKSYNVKTNNIGVAKIPLSTTRIGYLPITTCVSDTYYASANVTKHILVQGTKFYGSDVVASTLQNVYYILKVTDAKGNPLKNLKVTFTLGSKTYTAASNSTGVIKLNLGKMSKGTYTIKCTQGKSTGRSTITVLGSVTLKNVIAASKTVKSYIESNEKLPSTVSVGGISLTTAQYLYLASKAIVNLKSGVTSDIPIKLVANAKSPGSSSNLGNLNNYLSVAKSVISYESSNNVMPNSVSSDVGTIGYDGLVYAFSRVISYYGSENALPAYVAIKSISSAVSPDAVNTKNTITDLTAYLAASTNCQVNNAQIKALAAKLTSGLTSDSAKASAIYNYVRDSISYSFYYDTKHGAVGTLSAKSGNCVDQAHLVIALYRSAGLPARYVHGTCTFSSGSTYGHVWAQVLLGDVWTVSDPTSTRNSLGKVANWNTNSYTLKGYFSSISF